MLPESAFVSLTRLQSNGLLQSGLGIDSSIYHNVIGPDNASVYDPEHYVGNVLGLHTEYTARRRNPVQVNMFFMRCESSGSLLPFLLSSLIGDS